MIVIYNKYLCKIMYQSYFGKNAFENFQKILQFVYYSDFPILGEEIPTIFKCETTLSINKFEHDLPKLNYEKFNFSICGISS